MVCITENTVPVISIMNPNVDDDCQIIAYSPLDEPTQPDETRLKEIWPHGPIYQSQKDPVLMLEKSDTNPPQKGQQ